MNFDEIGGIYKCCGNRGDMQYASLVKWDGRSYIRESMTVIDFCCLMIVCHSKDD